VGYNRAAHNPFRDLLTQARGLENLYDAVRGLGAGGGTRAGG